MAESKNEPTNMPAAAMALEETRRFLVDQYAALESLRTRAIAMLSVGSLIAALFGSQLPSHRSDFANMAIAVAISSFGLSVLFAARVVRPRLFNYDHSVSDLLGMLEAGDDVRSYDVAVTWAKGYEADLSNNERTIKRLMWCLVAVCWLVGLQVIAWATAVL